MSINENNIIEVDDSTLLENTPMMVIENSLHIPVLPEAFINIDETLSGTWKGVDERTIKHGTPCVQIIKGNNSVIIPLLPYYEPEPEPEPEPDTPLTFILVPHDGSSVESSHTVKFRNNNFLHWPDLKTLYFRIGETSQWMLIDDVSTWNIEVPWNTPIQFKNKSERFNYGSTQDYGLGFDFDNIDGDVFASGNIQSLLNYSNVATAYCFQFLFWSCKNLITAPNMPATTVEISCYHSMYSSCNGLLSGPAILPAEFVNNSSYDSMFANCFNLENPPVIQAKELSTFFAINRMFYNCKNLNSITVHFKEWYNENTEYWVAGVSETGTFYKPKELPIEFGDNRIPEGWTVVDID